MAHIANVVETQRSLRKSYLHDVNVALDGFSLKMADLILICRKSAKVSVKHSEALRERMTRSINTLQEHIDRGEVIYGVNTGFGGNADTRTQDLEGLQSASLQHQQSGIITDNLGFSSYSKESESLPRDIAKALIVIRCNSLLRGHSAIRLDIIELLLEAVNRDIVPLIPRRGSISASGDLSPLSYIGGFLEGNPDIYASKRENDGSLSIISADEALHLLGRPAVKLRAKEGLAILNGTAASTAMASLVLHDCHNLAVLIQVMTAMSTEALRGNRTNFDPFISETRPHAGQMEVAANIRRFLDGSKLCRGHEANASGLAQDGYSLRTAPQWIGPQLEDLMFANQQVGVELNSTTDNPLIDVAGNCFHHGGNFQAASITSAMEKTRNALVMLGRLVLAQGNEIINPMLNKGLPPNLCFDDPSTSFTMKGADVNITAYFSELAYLANSVASHVQTADIGNQPVNSLALISARYTAQCVEILSMMCGAVLYELCQALDIRALYLDFLQLAKNRLSHEFAVVFSDKAMQGHFHAQFFEQLWQSILSGWNETTRLDLEHRCKVVVSRSVSHIMESFDDLNKTPSNMLAALNIWKVKSESILISSYNESKASFLKAHTTEKYLSSTSRAVYSLIRNDLRVPLNLGLEDHPGLVNEFPDNRHKKTIGTHIGTVFQAVYSGKVMEHLLETIEPRRQFKSNFVSARL